jgi:hypothetical protein
MFVSHPIDGAIYVARHRQRGGKILIWTRVPVAPGPETGYCRTTAIYEYTL